MRDIKEDEKRFLATLYEEIAGANWFNRNAITEKELIILILERQRNGVSEGFSEQILAEARRRFSKRES